MTEWKVGINNHKKLYIFMKHIFEKNSGIEQYEGYTKKGYRTFVEMNKKYK